MPPMARTSRGGVPANNVDALDNLDLDDMFTAGGDALFEGLDLDMGNMDEITTDEKKEKDAAAAASAPAPADAVPTRRKTKRKTTAPTFFDDLDDDSADHEPVKKKKRGSKASTTKKGRGKKGATAAEATSKGNKKSKASKTVPPVPTSTGAMASASSGISTPPSCSPRRDRSMSRRGRARVEPRSETAPRPSAAPPDLPRGRPRPGN